MFRTWIAATALSLVAGFAHAQTEVVVQYPYPELFEGTHKRIIEEFAKVRPDIKVTLRAPYYLSMKKAPRKSCARRSRTRCPT